MSTSIWFFLTNFCLLAKLSNSSSLEELAVFVRSMLKVRFCIAAFSLLDSSISFSISSFPTWLRTVESKSTQNCSKLQVSRLGYLPVFFNFPFLKSLYSSNSSCTFATVFHLNIFCLGYRIKNFNFALTEA